MEIILPHKTSLQNTREDNSSRKHDKTVCPPAVGQAFEVEVALAFEKNHLIQYIEA